jgi:predicted unusual protein kinase regulating ubiquinone biosynthesis (AarF/ABC1/UbiB family)
MTEEEGLDGGRPPTAGSSQGLGGRRERGASLARLSVAAGAGYVASRVRGLRDGELAEFAFHEATAQKVLEVLGSMKGAAMKVGQIASFVDVDLPPEVRGAYHEALAGLQASAPPADSGQIAAVIEEEYGAPPEAVFASWDPDPLASASIGQVHGATLADGTPVVTKVQYPGVAEAVEADLANAEVLTPLLKLIIPNLDVRPLIEELRARVVDELDYQREAQYQHAFWERYSGHPFVRVPRVHHELCRPRVLVMDRATGADFDTMLATADEAERQRYGEIIYRFIYGSLHRFRLFNADPHPGNYLFPGDGSVVFLDYGSVKLFPSAVRDQIQVQMRAIIAGDADGLIAALEAGGFIPASYRPDPERLLAWFRRFNEPILADAEWTYTPEFARDVIRSTTDPRFGPIDMLRKLNLPRDYLLLNRIQWGINSILGRLRARANWQRIGREFWDGAPSSTALGAEEAAFLATSPHLA